jgi:hypothetical protein
LVGIIKLDAALVDDRLPQVQMDFGFAFYDIMMKEKHLIKTLVFRNNPNAS